jgi:uncharacterized protein involved in exopolysaccharide biosynthesis
MDKDDSDENEGSGTPPLEQAKSYLAYGQRALRGHRLLAGVTAALVVAATIVAVVVWPRSYTCTTVLAAKENRILDGDKASAPLGGAAEVILSNENITGIVDELQLARNWESTLPPASRLKHRVMSFLRGEVSEAAKREALISMVQNNIHVTPPGWNESKLTISVDWHDGPTAAALADAADQSFLRARQVAEISTITEYITILEGHANELRDEIQSMAGQGKRDDKAAAAPAAAPPAAAAPSAAPTPAPAPLRTPAPVRAAAPIATEPPEDLSELRAQVEEKTRTVKEIEDSRQKRLADAEATLTELRTKFTAAHPMVVTAERNIAELSQDSPKLLALRGELKDLSAKLKAKSTIQREETAFRNGRGVLPAAPNAIPGASNVEPLPSDIMRLMQDDSEELDPAVSAQFRTAVNKYATLRDKIGTARVDLDTAQAAFKHRYQIVIPAEAPSKPSKPKVPVIVAAGLIFSLVAGLLAAVLAELKTGRVVERWQVDRLGVPLLGDVRWPPASDG